MFVCHCRAVTDRTVRRAIDDGARSIDDLVLACDAGARCGGCWPALEALLQEEGTTGSRVVAASERATSAA